MTSKPPTAADRMDQADMYSAILASALNVTTLTLDQLPYDDKNIERAIISDVTHMIEACKLIRERWQKEYDEGARLYRLEALAAQGNRRSGEA